MRCLRNLWTEIAMQTTATFSPNGSDAMGVGTGLFRQRRQRLMEAAGAGCAIVLPSASMVARNSDVEYEFRQNSDFFYLTGFDEPGAIAVLRPDSNTPFVLFVRPRDPKAETWHGRRAGIERAVSHFGADAAYSIDEFATIFADLLKGCERLGFTYGDDAELDRQVVGAARLHRTKPREGRIGPDITFDPQSILHETRLRKSADELAVFRRSAAISVAGHHEAMRYCRPGAHEYELQAALEYVFRASGAARVGYSSIVAAGDNATILHYNTNRMPIRDGDLVLIDAGAEVDYYTTDVTRTFPANGKFSAPQRAVYEVVLQAQLDSIDKCRAGVPFRDSHHTAVRTLTEGMLELGLLTGTVDELIETDAYKRYYMHRTGHWLGMDVHDVGAYLVGGQPRCFEPGMVTTIEPGLYIPADDEDAPAEFRGIGVRIEDDIHITVGDPENLTAACVKSCDDVERVMAEQPKWVHQRA